MDSEAGREAPEAARREAADSFEEYPLTRNEYITAVIHFYRGERGRADAWRDRLDPTTNWAVVTTGGMLSFAFNNPAHSHVTLLLANLLILVFLGFEARRFRYFDVWRARVRMIEENFFIPIFRRDLVSPRGANWRQWLAEDLDRPTFKIGFLEALAIRLRFNYIWLLLVLVVAWLAKLFLHPEPAPTLAAGLARMAIGPLPAWVVGTGVVAFYAAAAALALLGARRRSGKDEVYGVEQALDHWKT